MQRWMISSLGVLLFCPFFSQAIDLGTFKSVAESKKPCDLQKVDFVPAQEGFQKLGLPLGLGAVEAKIEFSSNGKDYWCSGNYFSDDGHILTSSHCLDGCGVLHIDDKNFCVLTINGEKQKVEIVAATKCSNEQLTIARSALKLGRQLADDLRPCATQGDLAVLKAPTPPKSFACLPLADDVPALGSKVFAFGHPDMTSRHKIDRPDARDSDSGFSVTDGEIVDSPTCDATNWTGIWPVDSVESIKKPLEPNPALLAQILASGRLQTTADSVAGFSGAGMVDPQKMQIVGVSSFHFEAVHNKAHECKGAVFYESTRFLAGTLTASGSKLQPSDFHCQQHHVTPVNR